MFALICLEAERQTGCFEATYNELAKALGKSKRVIVRYAAELETGAVCRITPARNQHARTVFQVRDEFWPYQRVHVQPADEEESQPYIESVRECYLRLGDMQAGFRPADAAIAKEFYERRIPLGLLRDAMLLGACRKYVSWLNGRQPPRPIQTLRYFEDIIAEIRSSPLPPGYSNYLERTLERFAAAWAAGDDGSGRARCVPVPQTPRGGESCSRGFFTDGQSAGAKKSPANGKKETG